MVLYEYSMQYKVLNKILHEEMYLKLFDNLDWMLNLFVNLVFIIELLNKLFFLDIFSFLILTIHHINQNDILLKILNAQNLNLNQL